MVPGADFLEVESNLRESFRALARERDSGEMREWPGVTIASLGVEFQMFNAAFLNAAVESDAHLGRLATQAAVHFQARGQQWALWVCESWIPKHQRRKAWRVIEGLGLRLSAEMPGMSAEALLPAERQLPELHFEPVANERSRRAFCRVGSSCFHVPPAWFDEVFDQRLPERDGFRCWVGFLKGEAVATAATVAAGQSIGLYNLGVAPDFRRRGFGEAALRFALGQAAMETGLSRTVLQSTSVGVRLYERLGYKAVTRFRVYTS
ncbi:MAG: hypothetical protein NVS1B6_12060 [Steroidobacteraceae bacterium]